MHVSELLVYALGRLFMDIKKFVRILICAPACLHLAGCDTLLLPQFNGGALNPDIRFLQAGEVMNGVKCAMTEFMREREFQLLNRRKKIMLGRRENPEEFLLLYAAEYPNDYRSFEKQIANKENLLVNATGKDNPLSPYALRVDKPILLRGERQCNFQGDGYQPLDLTDVRQFRHWEPGKGCVANDLYCPNQIGVALWDYGATDVYRKDAAAGGMGNCAPIPDYSRFALDRTQQASISLQLTATNQGIAFYDMIDARRIGSLQEIITPGSKGAGAVFPRVDFTGKGVTSFDMSVQMPQSIFLASLKAQEPKYASRGSAGAPARTPVRTPAGAPAAALAQNLERALNELLETGNKDAKQIDELLDAAGEAADKFANSFVGAEASLAAERKKLQVQVEDVSLGFSAALDLNSKLTEADKNEVVTHFNDRMDHIRERISVKYENYRWKGHRKFESEVEPPSPLGGGGGEFHGAGAHFPAGSTSERGNPSASSMAGANGVADSVKSSEKAGKDLFTRREVKQAETMTPLDQFKRGCGVNSVMRVNETTDLDYLALKDMLLNVVSRQNEDVSYQGGPELALDTLTLTVSFQLVLDANAGTRHIFHFFPMVTPPQMGVKTDHTHQLKIVLHGPKKKGDPNVARLLEKSCKERVNKGRGGNNDAGNVEKFCNSPYGKMLTSIADSLEKGGGQGSSSGGGQ